MPSPLSTVSLGYPRIGPRRELKFALEAFWAGKLPEADLRAVAAKIRQDNWLSQQAAGISHIPSGDFSFYDHVIDHAVLFGAVPAPIAPAAGRTRQAPPACRRWN